MADIIPAILPKSFAEIREKVGLVAGLASAVQVDICDGKFADNETWPYETGGGEFSELIVGGEKLPFSDQILYEFDLMVKEPEGVISKYARVGASRLIIHIESTIYLREIIDEWKDTVELGIAIRPKTPLRELENYMNAIKFVQCMGSDYIGHSGVKLDESTFGRIRELRAKYPLRTIGVDIGVNLETAPNLIKAGADRLAVGSAIFKSDDIAGTIKRFQALGTRS